MANVQIPLSPRAVAALSKPVNGKGGHQTLLRRLQSQINAGVLTASPSDIEKMLRYMLSYGSGGFQQRLAAATGRSSKRAAKKR